MASVGKQRQARIALVTASASRLNGGVFEAVVAHAALVRACGHEPVVFALEDAFSAADRPRFGDVEVVTCPVRGPRQIGFAPMLGPAMTRARLDLAHLHGLWMYPSRAAANWAAATGRPYVISPHGMLDPWILGRGKVKKAVARVGYEQRNWRLATRFHALTGREAADIAVATGRGDAALVIPNAVAGATRPTATARPPYAFYLGRIHPKKNLEALIDGWLAASDVLRPLDARLIIAGWGDDEYVAALKMRLAAPECDAISFVGPVYAERKAELLAGARYVALPSHSEGLPVVILEAWAAGTPTLMSQHCNLPQGFERGAAVDCGTREHSVARTLRAAFAASDETWSRRSTAAFALAEQFAPPRIAARWDEAYAGLLSGHG